jgi:hypothetical protein
MSDSSSNMSIDSLNLKEWEMANDRIKYFNQMCFQLRERGFLVSGGIQAVALASINYTQNILIRNFSLTSLILYFGVLYLIPIILLDMFYFHLLRESVSYAIRLEDTYFQSRLGLTSKLTSSGKTLWHGFASLFLYAVLISFGIIVGNILKTP